MKLFGEEENNLNCKVKNRKSWWEIKLKLDMKTHLFLFETPGKEKFIFFIANGKVRPVFVEII